MGHNPGGMVNSIGLKGDTEEEKYRRAGAIQAVEKVEAIIKAEKCRVDRIEEVFLNNPEEKLHESLVDKD